MTLEKFRIRHSELIEQYQFIEHELEGIYASLCGKPFMEGMEDVATDSLHKIISAVKKLDKEKPVLSQDDYDKLYEICKRRNFWCHNCYINLVFSNDGGPKHFSDVQKLVEDMFAAEEMFDYLSKIKHELLHS